MVRLGIDLMGSESSPQTFFSAALKALKRTNQDLSLFLFATPPIIKELSPLSKNLPIEFIAADEAVFMDDPPLSAVKNKKNSSMSLGIKELKDKNIDLFLTAGNSGALTSYATIYHELLPTIERPALLAQIPTKTGFCAILDVGANTQNSPKQLLQFSQLGSNFCKKFLNITQPKIGLLNIGKEIGKGKKELQEVFDQLTQTKGHFFLGNIESSEVFQGKVDILVTDGFTGNIFLKTAEALSTEVIKEYDHPAALLVGIDNLILKCHGSSNSNTIEKAILQGIHLVTKNNSDLQPF